MSVKHPVIAITGSSGAGTTSITRTFQDIFRRETIAAVVVEGDSFHRYDRSAMRARMAEAEKASDKNFSHFGPDANLLGELQALFKSYGESGRGKIRQYLHNDEEARPFEQEAGTFTPWRSLPDDTDLLFYEGLHGAVVSPSVNIAQHVDLRVGVVPIINLEWIQKLHRDKSERGYSTEAVVATILRRLPDYVNYITPQFSETHINFQRIATVDTSNPFVARDIRSADESMVIIRFANPRGIDFPYLLAMLAGSFMSRHNNIVIPGGKIALAMQLIFTPLVLRIMEYKRRAG